MENLSDNELLLLKWAQNHYNGRWWRLSSAYKQTTLSVRQAKTAMIQLSLKKLLGWHLHCNAYYILATPKGLDYSTEAV